MNPVPDRIEKRILLRAPRARVWKAISEARQFGAWFGVAFEGAFGAGERVKGRITPTQVDPEVAKLQEPHAGTPFEITIEAMEPEQLFSFRWHPYSVDPKAQDATEPTTLVAFELGEDAEGTTLTLTESGFSRLPLARRAEAYAANDGGWSHQMKLIEKYLG